MSFITKKLEEFDKKFPKVNYDKDATYIPDYEQYQKIKHFLSTALNEMINEVDTNISKLLQTVADSPLDKRLNGWDALLEVRKSLSSLREDNN